MFHVKLFLFTLFLLPLCLWGQQMGTATLETKHLPAMPVKDSAVERFLIESLGFKSLSDVEKDWFYWTNYSRKDPKRFWDSVVVPLMIVFPPLRNSYSASLKKELNKALPLPMLKPNPLLAKVAHKHAKELSAKKMDVSHTSPSGATFQERMESIGIQYCAGENISYGSWEPVLMLTLLYIDDGVPDVGHRKSLLNPAFVEMGIGVGVFPDKKVLIVQDFACAQ